ncbi:twin-arginine translocase subunit TatC [Haladaptatus caseinilyticus]|uniref:twin-arginine translocase subunit TatC n=1 Tax=Haladaptatus caseinilyticus TaxID=2993314 RepID=UPI00224B2F3F|nr:twin-arginine translocase subunit TatC [Haladaptatus caseinilyticus]
MGGHERLRLEGVLGTALRSVRSELRIACVVGVVGFLGTFYALRLFIWPELEGQLLGTNAVVVAVTPFDVVLLQAKIGAIVGVLFAGGWIVYRSRDRLVARGVRIPGRRRTHLLVGMLAIGLFVGGVVYAYVVFLPLLFGFLIGNAVTAGFQPTYSIVEWTQFVFLLTLVLGLTAELPLIMGGLVYADIVSPDLFRDYWRHAIFAIVVISSMVNGSPDPFSMSLVAIPMTALYFVGVGTARVIDRASGRNDTRDGYPSQIDLVDLDASGIRAAPPEAFADITEHKALELADKALDSGDSESAEAILDRFDERDERVANDSQNEIEGDMSGTVERTASRMAAAFAEEETTEDDIGGYYYDLRFVIGSLRSKSFRIIGVFMAVVALVFTYLYQGGIGDIKRDFLIHLPAGTPTSDVNIVLLHPVEALAFEMKVSLLVGVVAVLPLVLYYAWPAIETRELARANRNVFFVWAGVLSFGLLGGSFVGYRFVAPSVISYLVADALAANMIIAYRTAAFFWLVFATTVGIGLWIEVPVTMLLFHHSGVVRYRTMRTYWRQVAVGVLVATSLLPGGVLLMVAVGTTIMLAYGVGLGILWIDSLGERLVRATT